MHLPLVASLGPRNSMGWWRSLLGGWGMKKDHVSEGQRISSWQNPMIHNQDLQPIWEGDFFFGVSELP